MVNELLPHNGLLIKPSARIPRAFFFRHRKVQVHYGALDLLRLILMTIVFLAFLGGWNERERERERDRKKPLIVDQMCRPIK